MTHNELSVTPSLYTWSQLLSIQSDKPCADIETEMSITFIACSAPVTAVQTHFSVHVVGI